MTETLTPRQLTSDESTELQKLSDFLFGKEKFVNFSDETLASKEYQRYDKLLRLKMERLKWESEN